MTSSALRSMIRARMSPCAWRTSSQACFGAELLRQRHERVELALRLAARDRRARAHDAVGDRVGDAGRVERRRRRSARRSRAACRRRCRSASSTISFDSGRVLDLEAAVATSSRSPKSSGWISYSRISPSLSSPTIVAAPSDTSSMPSRPYTTSTCFGAEPLQHAHVDADEVGMEHADQLVGRAGRIGERAQDVEDRAHAELACAPAPRASSRCGGSART